MISLIALRGLLGWFIFIVLLRSLQISFLLQLLIAIFQILLHQLFQLLTAALVCLLELPVVCLVPIALQFFNLTNLFFTLLLVRECFIKFLELWVIILCYQLRHSHDASLILFGCFDFHLDRLASLNATI
jgi:hypothetical protein